MAEAESMNMLSCEEIIRRTEAGLCLFCDEQETPDHHLKHKGILIFTKKYDEDQFYDGDLWWLDSMVDVEVLAAESMVLETIQEEESTLDAVVTESNHETTERMVTICVPRFQVSNSVLEHCHRFCVKSLDVCEESPYRDAVLRKDLVLSRSGFERIKGKDSARQMFDKIFPRNFRLQQKKRKLRLSPKSWMFKYKEKNLLQLLPQKEDYNLRGGRIIRKLYEMIQVYSGLDQKAAIEFAMLESFWWFVYELVQEIVMGGRQSLSYLMEAKGNKFEWVIHGCKELMSITFVTVSKYKGNPVLVSLEIVQSMLVILDTNKALSFLFETHYNQAEKGDKKNYNFIGKGVESILLPLSYEYRNMKTACVLLEMGTNQGSHKLFYRVIGNGDENVLKFSIVGSQRLIYGSLPRPPEDNHSDFGNILQYHDVFGFGYYMDLIRDCVNMRGFSSLVCAALDGEKQRYMENNKQFSVLNIEENIFERTMKNVCELNLVCVLHCFQRTNWLTDSWWNKYHKDWCYKYKIGLETKWSLVGNEKSNMNHAEMTEVYVADGSIQWLENPRLITWHFSMSELKFLMGKKKVLLQGIPQGLVRAVKAITLKLHCSLEMKQENNNTAIERMLQFLSLVKLSKSLGYHS